jgi:hypothetical protein
MKQGFIEVPSSVSRQLLVVMQLALRKEAQPYSVSLDYMLGFAQALYLQGLISVREWDMISESDGWDLLEELEAKIGK